jgi:hypothetical protein
MEKEQIILGQTYMTEEGYTVTPIQHQPGNRALFVTDEFYPTPFVSWEYDLSKPNIILYRGNYYKTLDEALTESKPSAQKNQDKKLRVLLYCPDCEERHTLTIDLSDTVQSIAEQIDDARIICTTCGYTFMGIPKISLIDNNTTYDMPIWHGPYT